MSDTFFRTLAREAASAYPPRQRYARHFAFGKLTGDPAFEHILRHGLIPRGARLSWPIVEVRKMLRPAGKPMTR